MNISYLQVSTLQKHSFLFIQITYLLLLYKSNKLTNNNYYLV